MNPHIRVANVDRDRACEILREHFAVGRLTTDELTTRVAAAQTAVRWSDLQEIFYDLPPIPGMQLDSAAPAPMPLRPPMPASVYLPPRPVMPPADPAAGLRTAAWVCFALGFATCGVTWIPAVGLAIAATAAKQKAALPPGTERRPSRHSAAIIGGAFAAALLLLTMGGIIALSSSRPPALRTVEFEVSSSEPSVSIESINIAGVDQSTSEHSAKLPYRGKLDYQGDDDSDISASVGRAYVEGEKESEAEVTCSLIIDGTTVASDTETGSCSVSYTP